MADRAPFDHPATPGCREAVLHPQNGVICAVCDYHVRDFSLQTAAGGDVPVCTDCQRWLLALWEDLSDLVPDGLDAWIDLLSRFVRVLHRRVYVHDVTLLALQQGYREALDSLDDGLRSGRVTFH